MYTELGVPTAMQEEAPAEGMVFSLPVAQEEVAELRNALGAAKSPGERLQVLAELAAAAADLRAADDEAAGLAGECLDQTITGLTRLRPEFPPASEEALLSLYLLAEMCLLRDAGSDLDDATGYLRDLRCLLPPDDPDLLQVELELGSALIERCNRRGLPADLDEAVGTLTHVLESMDDDDPRRAAVLTTLALQRAVRYGGCNGPVDDREAALTYAAEGLTVPGATADTVAACHFVAAWMTLVGQLNSAHRSMWLNRAQMEGARRGGPEAAELLAAIADAPIDADDAETALRHLARARETTELDEDLRTMVPFMAAVATLNLLGAGRFTGDVTGLADELQQLARRRSPDEVDHGELLSVRAALLAAQAERGAGPEARDALTQAAAKLPPGHLIRPALLEQLRRTVSRQADAASEADAAATEVERLVDALEQMPPDDPEFARMLTVMAIDVLQVRISRRDAVPLSRLGARLEQTVAKLPLDDPLRFIGDAMFWAIVGMRAAIEHRPELSQQAVEGFMRCIDHAPADTAYRLLAYGSLASALADQYAMTGELRQLERSRRYVDEGIALAETASPSPKLRVVQALLLYLRGITELFGYLNQREDCDSAQAINDLEQAMDLVPPGHPLHPRLVASLETARIVRPGPESEGPVPKLGSAQREAAQNILAAAQSVRRDHPDFPALAAQAASTLMMQGLADLDPKPIDQAVALLADACAVPGLTFRERPRMLDALGFALLTRHHLTRQPRDLSNAIDRLEEARRAVQQEAASPYAANVLRSLANAYRVRDDAARGDVDRAITVGLDALREHAGDVLLQDTDEHALGAARRLITDAVEMARWSLSHGRPAQAIDALELGRGTVLHAATAGAGLVDILRDGGHGDLAAEWSRAAAPSRNPDSDSAGDLRYRIMTAIEGSPTEARLLAPPPLDDITAALRQRDVDALAYLLPRDSDGTGLAIIVRSGGAITSVPLPGLQARTEGPVLAYLRALQAVSQAGREGLETVTGPWPAALDDVCDWAWRTVIRPLLGAVPGRDGRLRRIALVPAAELGLVPWHAARARDGDGDRFACQEAIFSYAASARQFVDTARLQFRPWGQAPLLISDAAASAYATEIGICHLQTAFYPCAAVYGHAYERLVSRGTTVVSGSPAASPEDVIVALPHGASGGASLVHFGGHGQARVPVLTSRILLDNRKGPDGNVADEKTVAVRRILERARSRSPSVSGGLVVLASCLTDMTAADYDEALTLATAFLSAGAAGVVAARWRVPDAETALFMIMFHRYLNGPYAEPAAALHATQLWMLDPGRRVPGDLPGSLRERAATPAMADPKAWAGFTYQGR